MKIPVLRLYTVAYLIFLYMPIVILPLFAFNNATVVAFPLRGFTTEWFGAVWADGELHGALINSLIVAGSTSILATAFGVFAARASTRYNFPGKGPLMGLILLPMVLPEMIMAMSLLVVLLALGVKLSLYTVILGHVLVCTPFSVAILTSAFQSLDKSLEEAAYDLGEGPVSTFRLVILPLVAPGIISSMLICFTISIDEFIVSNFLKSGEELLSTYIYSKLRFPKYVPNIMALGTILVCVSITLLTLAEFFRRRGIARSGGKDSGGFV